jgi:hypothetical protein
MNWFEAERTVHQHVLRAEKAARQYPHLAHLLEQKSAQLSTQPTRPTRHINGALVSLGSLLVAWGEQLQERWAVELPASSGASIANNR